MPSPPGSRPPVRTTSTTWRDSSPPTTRSTPTASPLWEGAMAEPHVLFVCLHGAAKSVIAAMHFQQMAARRGLRLGATFAGTEPDAAIAPRVVKELLSEGIDVQAVRP